MVQFTNPIEEQAPPDLTGGYRTVDDNSIGDLFTNLGKTASVATDAYIQGQKTGAANEIAAYTDQIFSESGIAEEVNTPGLARDTKKLGKLAKASGTFSGNKGNLYSARLASFVKDMRQKYPQADVDKIVKEVTGINPKEYLLKSYQNELDNTERSELARTEKWTKRVGDGDKFASDLVQAYGGLPTPEQEVEAERIWLKYQSQANIIKGNTEATETNFRKEASFMFNQEITPVMVAINNAGAKLTAGGGLSGEAKTQLLGGISQARAKIAGLRATLSTKYGANVKIETQNQVLDSYDNMLKSAAEAVTKDDINMASYVASSFSWQQSEDTIALMEANPKLKTAQILVTAKLVDPAFTGTMLDLTSGNTDNFEMLVKQNAIAAVPRDEGISATNLFDAVNGKNAPDTKKSAIYRDTIQTVAKYLGDTSIDASYLAPVVERWLVEGTLGPAANKLAKGGSDLIAYMSSPKIIDNIQRTAPDLMPNVVNGLVEAVTTNKEFQDEITNIRNYAPQGEFVETATGGLSFTDTSGNYTAGTSQGRKNMPGQAATIAKLGPFNKALANLKYAVEKSGQDWNEYKTAIWQGMGIKVTMADGEVAGVVEEDPNLADINLTDFQPLSVVGDAISIGEGTADEDAYDTILGHQHRAGKRFSGVAISNMTLGDLKDFTTSDSDYAQYSREAIPRLREKGTFATPLGKYQIVGSTLRKLQKKMGLPDDTKFTPDVQDAMFKELLKGRGLDKYIAGKLTKNQFVRNLQGEWEGLQTSEKSLRALVEALDEVRGGV